MMPRRLITLITVLAVGIALSACGGGGGGGSTTSSAGGGSTQSTPTTLVGQFIDAPIAGLSYNCGNTTGSTNTQGQFNYTAGSSCTFSVGNVTVGALSSMPSDGMVTPQDIVGVSRTNTYDPNVQVVAQFLQSVGTSSSGTLTISPSVHQALASTSAVNLSQTTLTQIIQTANKPLVTAQVATSVLSAQLMQAGVNFSAGLVSPLAPPRLNSIVVSSNLNSNAAGLSEQLTATGFYSDGTTSNLTNSVTWVSSSTSQVSVSSTGLATGVSAGVATVSAVSSGGVVGSIDLTVTPAALASISVTPQSSSIASGLTQQMSAIGTFTDGTSKAITSGVTWSSSTQAAVISNSGVVIGRSVGTPSIKATVGSISGSTSLSVNPATLKSIAILTPNSVTSAPVGLSEQLIALGTYTDGTIANISNLVTWSSLNSNASLSSGLLTGISVGNSLIAVSYQGVTGTLTFPITPVTLQSIAITAQLSTTAPVNSSVPKGYSQNLIATGTFNDGTTRDITTNVTWVSSDVTVAGVSTGSAGGLATGLKVGSTNIKAQLGTVTSPQIGFTVTTPVLVSLLVSTNNNNVMIGSTDNLVATGVYSDNSTQDISSSVIWSVANTSLASFNSPGVLLGVAYGNSSVTASLGGISSQPLAINILPKTGKFVDAPVNGMAYNCGPFSGMTTATGQFNYSPGTACTFSVGNIVVGTLGAVPSDGVITPQDAAGVSRTATTHPSVQVIAQFLQSVGSSTAGTISISPDVTRLLTSGVSTSTPLISASGPMSQDRLASVVAGAGQTLVSPAKASSTLAAEIQAAGINTALSVVPAGSPVTLNAVVINTQSSTTPVGLGVQLSASGNFTDGTTSNLTNSVTWTSSNPAVMTVSTSGVATGVSTGSATITAQSNNGLSSSVSLSVSPATLLSISLSASSTNIPAGLTQQIIATGNYSDGSTQPLVGGVSWSSSNNWATVTSGVVMGSSQSSNKNTVITASVGSISSSITVSFSPAVLRSIAVTPSTATASLPVAVSAQLIALGQYSDGSTSNLSNLVTWVSDSYSSVNSSGLLTGISPGAANITARYQGVTSPAFAIAITAVPLQSISISSVLSSTAPQASSAPNGFSQKLIATGTYANGNTLDITSSVIWSSGSQSVATVSFGSAGGVVTGVSPGTSVITATMGSVTASITFTVAPPVLVSIAVSDPASTNWVGINQNLIATGTYSDNSTQNLTSSVSWSSSPSATVTSGGVLRGLTSGNAVITAAYSGVVSPSATLTIIPAPVTIGGVVGGLLSGQQVILTNNARDTFTVSSNGAFTFPNTVPYGGGYSVTINTQPTNAKCQLINASGTAVSNITSVVVSCAVNQYTVSNFVSGITLPLGLTTDTNGNMFVAFNNSAVDKITSSGALSLYAGSLSQIGSQNGQMPLPGATLVASPTLSSPQDIAFDNNAVGYIADTKNNEIRKVVLQYGSQVLSTLAGKTNAGFADGPASIALFNSPSYLVTDSSSNVYVTDTGNNRIRKISTDSNGLVTVSTFAGNGSAGSADGVGNSASFNGPMGLAIDSGGNLYVADTQNCTIRKITQAGVVSTFAGVSGFCTSADGLSSSATFNYPSAVTVDQVGNLYVTDTRTPKIRKITPDAFVITIAGTGAIGNTNGVGAVATFGNYAQGITVDPSGNVYVSDRDNYSIRKLSPGP